MQGGTDLLLSDGRGINNQGQIKTSMRPIIEKRLSSPTEGFNSYIEAQQWINEHLGLEIGYQAARNYLRLYFGTKLKVGRKTISTKPLLTKQFLKTLPEKSEHIKISSIRLAYIVL
jgi:hypothetical protein